MFHTDRVIVVEGRYDKARLSSLTDAMIITTEGFKIFSDKEKQRFIRKLADEKGLLILTDSDAAGFRIRTFLRKIAARADIVNVYIPDVFGKEKRKTEPSKEGKIGVEGIPNEMLENAIRRCGVFEERPGASVREQITNADLYDAGLTGKTDSANRRRALLEHLELPARLTGATLLQTLNAFLTREEFLRICKEFH